MPKGSSELYKDELYRERDRLLEQKSHMTTGGGGVV